MAWGGHHPLPFGAHTYLGPDTVCGSEAGGLEARRGGRRRREGSVQEPGLAGGTGCSRWRDVRAQPPYTHPVQAGGRAGSLLPLQGLPPAACQQALRAELFQGQVPASMQAGGTPAPVSPAPFPSVRPPQSRHNRHLGSLTHLYLACFYPCAPLCIDLLLSVLPLGGPRSSPLHTQP